MRVCFCTKEAIVFIILQISWNTCGKNVYEQLNLPQQQNNTTVQCNIENYLGLIKCVMQNKIHTGKIYAQLHTTLCIQFLDRENNDKNNALPLGNQICFTIVWSWAEILPVINGKNL